jgi:hypothetical protein
MKHFTLAVCLMAALTVAGCSSLKKLTGQTNDTVLPGQREEVIPPDQMTAKDPIVAGQNQSQTQVPDAAPVVSCDPKKKLCPPAPKTLQ